MNPLDTPAMRQALANPAGAEPVLATAAHLQPVLDELMRLEPGFHAAHPEATPAQFAQRVAPEFWEVGASGRRYSRAFALSVLEQRIARDEPASAPIWQADGFHLAEAGADHYLLTYTLQERTRLTRRLTVWRRHAGGWQAIYHQGTVVEHAGSGT